ncbi:MAG: ricin-type beta-trefoil lectin domain protein [Paenibacillus sp.]|nr:ricin-type beta-trefoil lectin domain protein [Paenibacillus sp.]
MVLSKIDFKIFRRQLWHVQDDGCLINLESDFVIDVAGGAFNVGSDIIQYHEKYLRKHRKNQVWSLSVDGHLHPKARPGLVLGAKGQKAVDGAEIQLHTRGSLDLGYQLWTFASPVFGRTVSGVAGVSAAGVLESNDSDIFIDSVKETAFETTTADRYERRTKLTVVRRWGLFPEGGFFIRSNYGDEHLSLTVEKKARTGENGRPEFEVTLRPINFKEYQWHFWFYQEGHLINAQTGLALDASVVKGLLVEDGLRTPLFVRDKSMTENQFWSLTVDGEVYLRSDERLVIGVSNSRRIAVSGAQVGLRELRVRTYMNENNQQESSLKSEPWLRWVFSKPVYGTKTTTTTTTTTSTAVSEEAPASGLVTSGEVVEGCTDEVLNVQRKEESADDYSVEDDDDSDSDEPDNEVNHKSSLNTTLLGNLGIATAGAGIMAGAAGVISNVMTSVPETISTAVIGKQHKQQSQEGTNHISKKTSYKSLKYDRKESYHASIEYVPTGFEKIIRYKSHQKFNFPTAGYFMIKSYLHGFVLDVVDGNTKDGAFVVLAPIKTTNFASQLWSFQDGRVINLKGHNLALDATMTNVVKAGERVVISTKTGTATSSDQHWEFGVEGGLIQLKSDRNLVLSVKELNRVTNKNATVDVYLQEEKSHLKSNFGRPEQRWEIKIPAMIPVEQTTNATSETKYTIIEGGKISAISSSVSAIIAFEWLKETFHHKVSADNQWPSTQNWFFIRLGSENAFLSSGVSDSTEIKFVSLSKQEDHKQFLWAYVDGYLVNYKYMLRLVYDKKCKFFFLNFFFFFKYIVY